MKTIVTKAFQGVPDGETQVVHFAIGDLVFGDLAAVALAEGWAKEEKPRGRPKKAGK